MVEAIIHNSMEQVDSCSSEASGSRSSLRVDRSENPDEIQVITIDSVGFEQQLASIAPQL